MRHLTQTLPVVRLSHIPVLLLISIFAGCRASNSEAYFFISNTSNDKKSVDIKVTIDTNTIFNGIAKYSNIAPDLQYTPFLTLPKGNHTIKVVADSSRALAEKEINLDNDRWIFVSYTYKLPMDSIEGSNLKKNFGSDTSWINNQLKGYPPKIIIHIMDKEPVHH